MNLFKRTTASVALVALVSGVFSTGVSAYDASELMAANAIAAKGYINTQDTAAGFNLDGLILRTEIAKVAANVAGIEANSTCENKFADVSATTPNTWACGYVEALLANGLVSANADYNPNANLTKAEAVKLMLTVAGEVVSYTDATWQADFVAHAVANGFVSSFSDYNTSADRGFVFSVAAAATTEGATEGDAIDEILKAIAGEDTDTETETTTETETVVSGDNVLEVTLSPLSPNASIVAAGKDRTPFLAFDVTAGSSDVELDDILLTYVGLSDSSGFDNIAVYLGNDKVTKQSSKGFDSDEEADLTFENDTVIKAGETMTLTVSGLVAAAGSVAHKIEVTEINASTTVTLGTVRSVTFDTVDASNTATLDIDVDSVTSTPTIGETITFAEFTLEEKLDNEDVVIKSITLEFGG
jgi:hypothetical protein